MLPGRAQGCLLPPCHSANLQGGWGGWPTGNGKKVSNKQPSMLPGPAVPGCCLISFHFLWAIHPIRPVQKDCNPFSELGKILFAKLCTYLPSSRNPWSIGSATSRALGDISDGSEWVEGAWIRKWVVNLEELVTSLVTNYVWIRPWWSTKNLPGNIKKE